MRWLKSPRRKHAAILLGSAAAILAVVFGLRAGHTSLQTSADHKQLASAQDLLQRGLPTEALSELAAVSYTKSLSPETRRLRDELQVDANFQLQRYIRLAGLYQLQPESFEHKEEAALIVARMLLKEGSDEQLNQLRNEWRGREQNEFAWFALDADVLLRHGEPEAAKTLLESREFDGPEDCQRLARLAILAANHDLEQAWQLLNQAFRKDPTNQDIRSFRGQFLETIGEPATARVEYVAAHLADPSNPIQRDQLAEFYRRQGNYRLAVETWHDGLKSAPLGMVWDKAIFWSTVTREPSTGLPDVETPRDGLQGYVEYLRGLPKDRFWDQQAFEQLPGARTLAQRRQSAYWLQVLQHLQDRDYPAALKRVEQRLDQPRSWHRELEVRLAQLLRFKTTESLQLQRTFDVNLNDLATQHPFWTALHRELAGEASIELGDAGQPNPSIVESQQAMVQHVANSPHAFSACMLATGWCEAALRLRESELRDRSTPVNMPEWYDYGIAQCLRYNRGLTESLAYLSQLSSATPKLRLLQAELRLANNQTSLAIEQLEQLYKLTDLSIQKRATWLLVESLVQSNDLSRAKQRIQSDPKFAASVLGRELYARILLLEGKDQQAANVYAQLGDISIEGTAYRARQAFAKKDYSTARQLTETLLERIPDSMRLLANMQAILAAEKGHEASQL